MTKPTTPQDIFEYKQRWMNNGGFCLPVDEFLDFKGIMWCKQHLEPHQWGWKKWTNVYEHTFCFEDKDVRDKFERYMTNLP